MRSLYEYLGSSLFSFYRRHSLLLCIYSSPFHTSNPTKSLHLPPLKSLSSECPYCSLFSQPYSNYALFKHYIVSLKCYWYIPMFINIVLLIEKQEGSRKAFTSALLTTPKPLTVWITTNCGKFFKRWEYQTTWPEKKNMQVKKQHL